MSDVIFSLQFIILFSDNDGRNHCNVFSFLFQFSVLSSQSWYFMNAVDLLRSMRNPFTDPKANIPIYHVFVWGMSLCTSIAIDATHHDSYRMDMQLCWTSVTADGSLFNYVNWLTFFIPTLCYYFFSIGTMVYAGLRLKKGLQETFATRQIVLFNGIRYVAGFCAYWTFAGIIYGIIMLRSQNGDNAAQSPSSTGSLPLYATFAVTIAFRGVVDVCIWVYNQKVLVIYKKWWAGEPHEDPADIGMNDADINRALRREVLIFSTTGIALAIDRANGVPFSEVLPTIEQYPFSLDPSEPRNMHSVVRIDVHREDFSEKMLSFLPAFASTLTLQEARNRAVTVGPEGVPFLDYAPQVFRYLRFQYGIDEGSYARSIQGKTEAMIEKLCVTQLRCAA
jgi:hypothetical protein